MEKQTELWYDFFFFYRLQKVLFPSQYENIIHGRHLTQLNKTAPDEGVVLYRLCYFSCFYLTPLPGCVPRSHPVPVDILSSECH